MEVSNKIKQIRNLRGYSQSYMAQKLAISQRAYSKIELNQTQLNWEKLNKIAGILNLGIWELVDQKNKYNPNKNNAERNVDLLQQLINQYENRIITLEKEVFRLKSINKV